MRHEHLQQQLEEAEKWALPLLQKYYCVASSGYRILLTHSHQVARKCMEILLRHPELDVDTSFVFQAAYLHDIGVFMCNAPAIGCNGSHRYIEHGYLGADLLREEGLLRHALVAERHTGVGISEMQIVTENLPIPRDRTYQPVILEEKIVSYADKFYSKTHLEQELTQEKIHKNFAKFGAQSLAIFTAWEEMFG